METVEFQSFVFLYTLYGGLLIGIIYDIYRALRGTKRKDRLITSFWDIFFLVSVLLVIIWALFSSNYGDLRAYVFVGFIVGFFLYEKILSRIAFALFVYLKRNIVGFFKTTNSLIFLPFKFIINLLWYPMGRLLKYVKSKRVRLKKIKDLPKTVYAHNKKYFNLVVRRKNRKKT